MCNFKKIEILFLKQVSINTPTHADMSTSKVPAIKKVSKSEKVREDIVAIKTKNEHIIKSITETKMQMRIAQQTAAYAKSQIEVFSKKYNQALKDEEIFKKRIVDMNADKADIAIDLESKEIELSVVKCEEAEKADKTKGKKKPDQFLAKINKLPEDVVQIIGEYLPYIVRIGLLESKQKTSFILNKMTTNMTFTFLQLISTEQDWLNILPYKDAIKEIRNIPGEPGINPLYDPFSSRSSKKAEDIRRIKYILNLAKEVNPKFVYNTIKMFHILLNPNKTYIINRDKFKPKTISIGI